ncbi:hypothetical protein BUL40_12840 [Croceivirga radicis]|uniref:DUF1684 domain-containing protein n=1 Tax=Croceivirga radicis TaxID=1929488 RepID=A0A1V6LP98_9FLAO|nr:DUF1684 domain-containing protein [Croceivirga radicis]OQD41993.1 hypothetical protein BUL40_12840 [Croceivirga radicis]
MNKIVLVFLVLFVSCGQKKKYHDVGGDLGSVQAIDPAIKSILTFQENLNKEFKDPDVSPLPDRYRKDFEGLEFYEPDTNYIVTASLVFTPDSEPILMPTTTDRQTLERLYAIAHFQLNGKQHQLEIYQSLDLMEEEGYEDYLFLPFLDETNGLETYGGGRYIDLRLPKGDTIIIDFNKAYNPYCVYNKKYSCPLVPRQNYMKTKVAAGVKDFKKH